MQVRLVAEYKALYEKCQQMVEDGKMDEVWIDHYSAKIKANINGSIKTLTCDEDLEELITEGDDETLENPPESDD